MLHGGPWLAFHLWGLWPVGNAKPTLRTRTDATLQPYPPTVSQHYYAPEGSQDMQVREGGEYVQRKSRKCLCCNCCEQRSPGVYTCCVSC